MAKNIELLAKEKGIKKTEACIESGAGQSFISNMIGKGQSPTFDKVLSLAEYFNVSIDYLIGYTPNSTKNSKIDELMKLIPKLNESKIELLIDVCTNLLEK